MLCLWTSLATLTQGMKPILFRYVVAPEGQIIRPPEGFLLKIVQVPIEEKPSNSLSNLKEKGRPWRNGRPT